MPLLTSQDVIGGSDNGVTLQLTNLVEGVYTFHLLVTDSQGASDSDTATVEVLPGVCGADVTRVGVPQYPASPLGQSHRRSLYLKGRFCFPDLT